jgi:GDP-L-fucose synthase
MNAIDATSSSLGKVYVAGHRGLVGSALVRRLSGECSELVSRTHAELDLTDAAAVMAFFASERPTTVLLAAARVGGILANRDFPAEFIRENLAIELNVLEAAREFGVRRLLFMGSSCIYPRDCPQPIREEYLLTGPVEATNRAYAVAKIAGIELCAAFNRQYGTEFLAVMPTNLYGVGDNYDSLGSHVLPGLIRRFHEAKQSGAATVEAWGSGRPRREFLCSEDLADACAFLLNLSNETYHALTRADWPLINVGTGKDLPIAELVELVKSVVGYRGTVTWDASKPDGTRRKLLDVSRLRNLGWEAKTSLADGAARAYEDFIARGANG